MAPRYQDPVSNPGSVESGDQAGDAEMLGMPWGKERDSSTAAGAVSEFDDVLNRDIDFNTDIT
ncbi:MAG: hypothetical protein ACF8PN_08200 [Phycisphaerales bacterium]